MAVMAEGADSEAGRESVTKTVALYALRLTTLNMGLIADFAD